MIPSPARWPLRIRLTIAFTAVMAVVLTTVGGVVYLRLASSLDATISLALHSRADDVVLLVQRSQTDLASSGHSALTERGESIAQVVSPAGRVLDATPGLHGAPLLSATELAATAGHALTIDRARSPVGDDPVRLFAVRTTGPSGAAVVVVGASVDARREAMHGLAGLFLIGGPITLLLAAGAGYWLAAASLRPVDRMRREADAITATDPGARLAVPAARDEIGRLGHTLNDLLARVEAAVEQERAFVSDASHELRTPLAILQAELEFALRPVRTPAEHVEALQSAAGETERLVRLAEDLLVLARADAGGLVVRREPVFVGALLGDVAARFARAAAEAGVVLRVVESVPGEDTVVSGDRLRLEQALGNLVENALRHAASEVVLGAAAGSGRLLFTVTDDGPGFDAALLPRAFDRFTRGDAARGEGGTGLGLAIVAAVARAHGGSATAANRVGGGADVRLTVTLAPSAAPVATQAEARA